MHLLLPLLSVFVTIEGVTAVGAPRAPVVVSRSNWIALKLLEKALVNFCLTDSRPNHPESRS